jgi:hypothetical protein
VKIKRLAKGQWEFDSGEIQGQRTRRVFETEDAAGAFLRKAKKMSKDEGERILLEWLTISGNEMAEIVRYRREMVGELGHADWQTGRKLHLGHLTATKHGGLLSNLLGEYIQRKRKAGRNGGYSPGDVNLEPFHQDATLDVHWGTESYPNTATHFLVWRLTGLERKAQLGIWDEDNAKETPDWEKWANQKPAQVVVTGIPEAVKVFSWPLKATSPVPGSANSQ